MGRIVNNLLIVSENVKALRRQTCYPISAIADYLGVPLRNYVELESGCRDISDEERNLLSNLYGIEPGDFFIGHAENLTPLGKSVAEYTGEDLRKIAEQMAAVRYKNIKEDE